MSEAKVVLITGCSTGVGRALAEALLAERARDGSPRYRVFATARRPEALADLKAAGAGTLALDVRSCESVEAAVAEVIREAGRVDVLVNNAGVNAGAPLLEQPMEEVEAVLDTNLLGIVRVVQAVGPHMLKQRSGLIVNIASTSATFSTPFQAAYTASKAGVHALSDSLRLEVEPFGVRVSTVILGAVATEIWQKVLGPEQVLRIQASAHYSPVVDLVGKWTDPEAMGYRCVTTGKAAARIADVIRRATKPCAKPPPVWFAAGGSAKKGFVAGLVQKVFGSPVNAAIAEQGGLHRLGRS